MAMDDEDPSPTRREQGSSGPASAAGEVVHRILVSAPTPEGEVFVARLSLQRQATAYTIIREVKPETPTELTQALEVHLAPLTNPGIKSIPAEKRWEDALKAMRLVGWTVEEAGPDLSVTMTIDGKTGRVFVDYRALNVLAEANLRSNAEITERSLASISEMFATKAREHAASASAATRDGRLSEVPKLLKEADIYLWLFPQQSLLDALYEVDVTRLAHEDAVAILETRILLSHGLRDHVGFERDYSQYLVLTGKAQDPTAKAHLLLARANAAGQKLHRESAVALYHSALHALPSAEGLSRAWAYRGLSLRAEAGSVEQLSHEELAMDAFLTGGDLQEATTSAVAIVRAKFRTAPEAALSLLGKAMTWASSSNPYEREKLASLHHERAQMLRSLGRFQEARFDAEAAAELRRGLLGSECARIASLELAGRVAKQSGDEHAASEFHACASRELALLQDANFVLGQKLAAAKDNEGWPGIARLRSEVEASGDEGLKVSFFTLEGRLNLELSVADRLALLDTALFLADKQPRRLATHLRTDVAAAFAVVFESEKNFTKALEWHQKVLEADPYDAHAVGRVASLLLRLERWGDAIVFAEKNLELFGRKPGWLLYLGRVQLRDGHPQEAFTTLKEAETLAPDETMMTEIRKWKEAAFNACEKPPERAAPPLARVVTRELFESTLNDFVAFVASEKRMSFWKAAKDGKGHEWAPKPEQLAKHLLQTFLKGRFSSLVESLEEVMIGAGRIDLYLIFSGGLRVVVELKMCGGGYSTQYALEGVEQLLHYLDQKGTSLGYLIVFDGRIDSFNTGLPAAGAHGSRVIVPIAIDVRPKVKPLSAKPVRPSRGTQKKGPP